jgi:uncharacterized protein YdeI (BOF family)
MKTRYSRKHLLAVSLLGGAALLLGPAASATTPPASATTPPAAATATETRGFHRVADVKRGELVVLRGEVSRIADEDEFILTDDSGRIRVYIGWENDLPVKRGDRVIVEGRADDDAIFGTRPEIYARVLELADGTRVELRP